MIITGERFRELRRELGFTQLQIGKELGVTRQTIREWETKGKRIPKMAEMSMRYICGKLGKVITKE